MNNNKDCQVGQLSRALIKLFKVEVREVALQLRDLELAVTTFAINTFIFSLLNPYIIRGIFLEYIYLINDF